MVFPSQLLSLASCTAFMFCGHIVVLVALSNNGRCPSSAEDIDQQASRCLESYRAFEDRYQLSGSNLFASVDVEIIRTLCSDMKASMRCLRSLRDRCSLVASVIHQQQQRQQQQQHISQIDAAIRPYLSVVELCEHQHLYEDYAMNQNCLHGQREASEKCYRAFLITQVEPSKSTEHVQLQLYCGHLTQLMTCVRSNFVLSCGQTAVMLVEKLVKAAVDGSHQCRTGSNSNTHETTVSPQKSGQIGSNRRSNSAQPLRANFVCRTSQLILVFTLSLSPVFIACAFGN